MRRSLLIKAGLALAPDAFQYVLDSENELKGKEMKILFLFSNHSTGIWSFSKSKVESLVKIIGRLFCSTGR